MPRKYSENRNRLKITFALQYSVLKPKKSYGQNFLINDSISQRIVDALMQQKQGSNVLEVGPGKGALTKYLLQLDNIQFKAIEADWEMIHFLQQEYGLGPETLLQGDFLSLPLEKVFDRSEFNIIGNFPYNISSQILFRILKYKDCVPTIIGMFQSEVAERIASGPGSKIYGVISVLMQASYHVKLLFKVNPGSFFPAPKVISAVLLLERKAEYTPPCDYQLFRRIVKGSFNQRRKMLRNTLKPFIRDEQLFQHELMTQRPEQLSLDEFYELTNLIHNQDI